MPDRLDPERRAAFWLFASLLLLYGLFYSGRFTSSDEVSVFEMARSLVLRGDLSVPAIAHTGIGADGETRHSPFAVGQSVLAAPLVVLAGVVAALLPAGVLEALAGPDRFAGPNARLGGRSEIFVVGLYSPLATALLVTLYFRFQRRLGASGRSSLLAAVALGAGSYVFSLSSYFLRHPTEALLALGALWGLHGWHTAEAPRRRDLWIASLCASSLILVRVPSVVFGLGFGAAVAVAVVSKLRRGRAPRETAFDLVALLVPLVVAVALHAGINWMRWGHPFESPMTGQHAVMDHPMWLGITGLLASPGVSLFLYAPVLCIAPHALWTQRRREPLLIAASVGIFVCFLAFVGSYRYWPGLWSAPGPRYLYLCIPLLLLPLGPWLDERAHRARILLGFAAVGVCIQVLLLLAPWAATIAHMGYAPQGSEGDFLWSIREGPLVGSFRTLSERGLANPWLWTVATGWRGHPGAPLVAAAWLGVGLVGFGFAAARCHVAVARLDRSASAGG